MVADTGTAAIRTAKSNMTLLFDKVRYECTLRMGAVAPRATTAKGTRGMNTQGVTHDTSASSGRHAGSSMTNEPVELLI
eukprot:54673-Eustigmatos_ZCMA.PRE.1